ncbi:hypothetical protein V8G54_030114 [Vigna mungo]|uniref:Uncharacterized protein n=1 Tax=Vigna mungo TaxID=3915 RepID=A0AAQ3RMI5_VIGMU
MVSEKVLPSDVVESGHAPLDSGHARLRELGYRQELKRDLSVISNFAFSFSIMSVLTGVTTVYNTGLNYGGPVSFVYGWFIVSAFTMIVALPMAEICSSYPTSGGLYYWSAKLAGPRWAPFVSWITGCAVGITIVVGWFYILGITFAVTDILSLLSEDNDAGGYAIAEVFYQAFKKRYGNGSGGIVCLVIVGVAIFFCGMSSVTSNSRMAYAFSRDGAMPLSSMWHQVNKQEVPICAVWLSVSVSFCMALTSLGSIVAFHAMVSMATIGLYIAYAFPIFFRVTLARKHFVPGPFNLGRYGVIVGWVAVLWVQQTARAALPMVALPVKLPPKTPLEVLLLTSKKDDHCI